MLAPGTTSESQSPGRSPNFRGEATSRDMPANTSLAPRKSVTDCSHQGDFSSATREVNFRRQKCDREDIGGMFGRVGRDHPRAQAKSRLLSFRRRAANEF